MRPVAREETGGRGPEGETGVEGATARNGRRAERGQTGGAWDHEWETPVALGYAGGSGSCGGTPCDVAPGAAGADSSVMTVLAASVAAVAALRRAKAAMRTSW